MQTNLFQASAFLFLSLVHIYTHIQWEREKEKKIRKGGEERGHIYTYL